LKTSRAAKKATPEVIVINPKETKAAGTNVPAADLEQIFRLSLTRNGPNPDDN
jgi:hypothetical protein